MQLSDAYHQLSYYTLAHPDRERFVHQHIVDAYTAQTAGSETKPIGLLYALVGLYLALERGYTGKEVQRAHMDLARDKTDFPALSLPERRGALAVDDILRIPAGAARDGAIMDWCREVWAAYAADHAAVADYCARRGL